VAVYAKRLFKSGVKMVGGCCGTKPHHIAQVASAARMFGGGGDLAPPIPTDAASSEKVLRPPQCSVCEAEGRVGMRSAAHTRRGA
jgi:hypothetical protein